MTRFTHLGVALLGLALAALAWLLMSIDAQFLRVARNLENHGED